MTVEELIHELSKYPKDTKVFCRDEGGDFEPAEEVVCSEVNHKSASIGDLLIV